MKILLINHYAGSPQHGMEYRPYYLAREWVRAGHEVTIAAASFSHLRQKAPACAAAVCHEEIEGINYVWLRTPGYHGNGAGRVANIFTFICRMYAEGQRLIAKYGKPTAVIASSTYPFDIYPARHLSKRSGAKLLFEVHDLWPLTPIELGGISPRHPLIMLMQRAENYAYRTADRVVSMLPKAYSYMEEHGMAAGKFSYLPNGIVVDEWRKDDGSLPDKHRIVIDELKKKGQFLVGYAGGHGVSNALDQLLAAANLLKDYPVSLVLVGDGPEKLGLQQKAMEMKISNLHFLPPVDKGSIPALLAAMDSLYIGWSRKPIYRFGICPNKLMDYMMAAKPVVHAVEAGNDLVAESGCGISVPPEDPQAIKDAIVRMQGIPEEERHRIGNLGREYVLRHHDYRVLAQRFLQLMEW